MCFRVAGVQLLAEQPILEEDNPATFKENQNNPNQNKFFFFSHHMYLCSFFVVCFSSKDGHLLKTL